MNTPVSFEIAKLLKTKGFDKECKLCMEDGDERPLPFNCGNTLHRNSLHPYYSAPTIAEVVMWLYGKHGIWIFLIPQSEGAVAYRLESSEFPALPLFILILKYEKDLSMNEVLNSSDPSSEMFLHFDNPTEAYEAAIKYCLEKLI